MSCIQFLDQIQALMHTQQIKNLQTNRSNYAWLSNKKCTLTFMSPKEEFSIRQAVYKINQEDRTKVIQQLLSWLDEHPFVPAQKVVEMSILFLTSLHAVNVMNQVTLSRQNSFRNSFRRLSNKIAPSRVTFDDKTKVYCITD